MEQSSPDEPESPETLEAGQLTATAQTFVRRDRFRRSFDKQSYKKLQRTNSVNYGSKNSITDLKKLFEKTPDERANTDLINEQTTAIPKKTPDNELITDKKVDSAVKIRNTTSDNPKEKLVNIVDAGSKVNNSLKLERPTKLNLTVVEDSNLAIKSPGDCAKEVKTTVEHSYEKASKDKTQAKSCIPVFKRTDDLLEKGKGEEVLLSPKKDKPVVPARNQNSEILKTKPIIPVKPLKNEAIAQRVSNIEKLQSSLKTLFEDTPILLRKNPTETTNLIEDSPVFQRRNSCENKFEIEKRKASFEPAYEVDACEESPVLLRRKSPEKNTTEIFSNFDRKSVEEDENTLVVLCKKLDYAKTHSSLDEDKLNVIPLSSENNIVEDKSTQRLPLSDKKPTENVPILRRKDVSSSINNRPNSSPVNTAVKKEAPAKRVSFSLEVERIPIPAPRKHLPSPRKEAKVPVEVVTVEVKTAQKELVTPVQIPEETKKDVNSNFLDSLGANSTQEIAKSTNVQPYEVSACVRKTKDDKERFLNEEIIAEVRTRIPSNVSELENKLSEEVIDSDVLLRPREQENARKSDSERNSKTVYAILSQPNLTQDKGAEKRSSLKKSPGADSQPLSKSTGFLYETDEELNPFRTTYQPDYHILPRRPRSSINSRSAIFARPKQRAKIQFGEPEERYIIARESSDDSIDKIQSVLDQFIMDDKKEKKRTNSFKKMFKNFSRKDKDKKKPKKVENEVVEDNAQNESFNRNSNLSTQVAKNPTETKKDSKDALFLKNKELPEIPTEEVEKRYAQMHINRYNHVRANFEQSDPAKYSEDYVCMDNGGNKYSYINTSEVSKYIDTSSSSNTIDSENLAFRDSDNSSGLEVKNDKFFETPPRAFDTYQNVQLVKPKANIPISSERPLPLPYQDYGSKGEHEAENANNKNEFSDGVYGTVYDRKLIKTSPDVSISDRSLSSRSPSLEGTKLKMPINREKVDLQPRIRSPIPPSEVSTDKIIATELLKNKKERKDDKRSSPSHQRLEIEIDYPDSGVNRLAALHQEVNPKGKPPISPQSKVLQNLEAGEWHRKQREMNMAPSLEAVEWQKKQREGMSPNADDWKMKQRVPDDWQGEEMQKRQRDGLSPNVENWKQREGMSPTQLNQEKRRELVHPGLDWQGRQASVEQQEKAKREPSEDDWKVRQREWLYPNQEGFIRNNVGASPSADDWQVKQRDLSISPSFQERRTQQMSPATSDKQQVHSQSPSSELMQILPSSVEEKQRKQMEMLAAKERKQTSPIPEDWQRRQVQNQNNADYQKTLVGRQVDLGEYQKGNLDYQKNQVEYMRTRTGNAQNILEYHNNLGGQQKVNNLAEWQRIHSKPPHIEMKQREPSSIDIVEWQRKVTADQADYLRRPPVDAIKPPSLYSPGDHHKRSPSSETNRMSESSKSPSVYSSANSPNGNSQMTTNVLVHVDSHSPQNRSVTPVSRSTTPVTLRSPSNLSLQRTPPKHEIRQSVEAFCWKELKKMKEQEDIQMQIQLSNYGYLEDPIISHRSRSMSPNHARNTRRSSSLPREVQRQRRLEDAGITNRPRVESIYGQRVAYNPNFVRNSPQRNTIGTATVGNNGQRPIFKRGSLSQNYNPEAQALYYKKVVGFHSPQNPDNPQAWPTKNGYTQSPPQRRLEIKREASLEDEVFVADKIKEPIYGSKGKEPTREEIFLMNQQRQRQMREMKEPVYDFRPLPNEQMYRQNGQQQYREPIYGSRQQVREPIYGSRVMPNISEEGLYGQKIGGYSARANNANLQRNNSFTQRYDYPPNEVRNQEPIYSRNPQEIYGRLGQRVSTVNNKVCDIYGKIHDGAVQKSGVLYGQLQRNTNAPPMQYQSYNQLQNQNFVRGTRLTASVNDMNRYYHQDPRFRQQHYEPPDRPLPPIPNDKKFRKHPSNTSDTESTASEVQRIFQMKNRIAGK